MAMLSSAFYMDFQNCFAGYYVCGLQEGIHRHLNRIKLSCNFRNQSTYEVLSRSKHCLFWENSVFRMSPAGLKLGPRFDFDSLTDVPCATVATFQINED